MASRPFASINVALETDEEPPDLIGGSVKAARLHLPGLAVASALVDISQQMPIAYKEKSGGVRNRKQQPPAQPGTCI
ncbi:hypothetical protein JD844_026104 [Phrynosoma platyrhinos]|uniref:Uncharacterized protein n=1 Tax=Phrynosoma platyrhinos TaxID=52577 RepID=A0ABQ7SEH4_PHRPL|nr:hypothetical protein JD844_026104 [Phrynosoma platyrhinos]